MQNLLLLCFAALMKFFVSVVVHHLKVELFSAKTFSKQMKNDGVIFVNDRRSVDAQDSIIFF